MSAPRVNALNFSAPAEAGVLGGAPYVVGLGPGAGPFGGGGKLVDDAGLCGFLKLYGSSLGGGGALARFCFARPVSYLTFSWDHSGPHVLLVQLEISEQTPPRGPGFDLGGTISLDWVSAFFHEHPIFHTQ